MSEKKDDGGPAFPNNPNSRKEEGMTKREFFAVMAMQGWLAGSDNFGIPEDCAQDSVRHADALIAELKK